MSHIRVRAGSAHLVLPPTNRDLANGNRGTELSMTEAQLRTIITEAEVALLDIGSEPPPTAKMAVAMLDVSGEGDHHAEILDEAGEELARSIHGCGRACLSMVDRNRVDDAVEAVVAAMHGRMAAIVERWGE